ncbi:MAG TPA: hypothetical protein VKG82_08575 [Solirubrobacteraceae bacterium]|nr:hypothetical protein [Solirubrobacteraceae bacterium]
MCRYAHAEQQAAARGRVPMTMRWAAAPCARAAAIAALLLALAGCGSAAHTTAAVEGPQASCEATVVEDLARVVRRVYREGVRSERTLVAQRMIASSAALRTALSSGDAAAAQAAAQALVASGHVTNVRVLRGGAVLAQAGGPALAPITGQIASASGAPLGTYVASVWSDEGFLIESDGIAQGRVALRRDGRSVGGSLALAPGKLPAKGSTVLGGVPYAYASFGAIAYPWGPLRVYVFRSVPSTTALCGATREATTFKVLSRVAKLIYEGEAGRRTLAEVRRVQANAPLLEAVVRHDPVAARHAVELLLNQHIVRMRVYDRERLLADVGGPYVLAPVDAPLRLHGHTIGHFVLSIQDDEGYLRLTRRLAGLSVLMYTAPNAASPSTLVKNSLGPEPGNVPESGRYTYRGASFQVYTLRAEAFPSGPLTIRVLIPVPYR